MSETSSLCQVVQSLQPVDLLECSGAQLLRLLSVMTAEQAWTTQTHTQ